MQNPTDLTQHVSTEIPADASASQVYYAIRGYYWTFYRTGISVNKTMYDINGTETTNSTNATQIDYFMNLTKLINVTVMSVSQI